MDAKEKFNRLEKISKELKEIYGDSEIGIVVTPKDIGLVFETDKYFKEKFGELEISTDTVFTDEPAFSKLLSPHSSRTYNINGVYNIITIPSKNINKWINSKHYQSM